MAYMEKVRKELARMILVLGEVMQIIVHHKTECLVFEDQECNCDPRIEFIAQDRN